MKKHNILFYFILLILLNSCNQKDKTEFYLPAEWEPQSAVIVGGLEDAASFEMVSQLAKELKVYCLVADSSKEFYEKKLSAAGINLDSIKFLVSSTNFSYAQRDGLMFMKNENGEKQLVNFAWNMYGWYFIEEFKNYIDSDKKRENYILQSISMHFPFLL